MEDEFTNLIQPSKDINTAEERLAGQQRRMVTRYDRAELEDLYLRTYDENIALKKHTRKQEDKIKRMATKLLRLVNDQKKANKSGQPLVTNIAEERVAELQDKLRDAEKQNTQLKEKLSLQRVAMATNQRTSSPWNNVRSRINTGQKASTLDYNTNMNKKIASNLRVTGPKKPGQPISPKRKGSSDVTLKKSRTPSPPRRQPTIDQFVDNRPRDEFIHQLEEELHAYKQEVERLMDENHQRDEEQQENLLHLKQKITAEQRTNVQENIDVIRLQREVKQKSFKLSELQETYMLLDDNLRTVKHSHDALLIEMEHMTRQLKDEQNRVLSLHSQLKSGSNNERRLLEFHEQIVEFKKDNEILKDANEKLVTSAFDMEREREWKQREIKYRLQIAQLEATLKADLGEKGTIIDRLTSQRVDHEQQEKENQEMKMKYLEMKEKYEEMETKLKFFSKGSGVDFTEVEEALVLIKQKKQREAPAPDFLLKIDEEKNIDGRKRLLELQAEYAETIHELEKTRNLLVMQHKINKDYQLEVKATSEKMEDMRTEYDMKLDEYAHLLDIRAARIKKLEAQLRDVAYGTRQYKLPRATDDEDVTSELDETIKLERGQNLFEIHIINDDDPSLFCTWEFFDFEIQSTPVIRTARPLFDFTSQYIVKVDDFFLHYLQKDTCTLELHQAFGQDYETIAACQLSFRDLFEKPHGRIHGQVALTGVNDTGSGVGFGALEYWVRLKVPMDQALRRYKERTKALGYISTNQTQTQQMMQALGEKAMEHPSENVNELHITITRCVGLQARRPDIQPSPYCIYQFYDFNDHDTTIRPDTNDPEYNDHQSYPVPMTYELDNYLKKMPLKIFVFDDQDPEDIAYMGMADVALIPLVHDKPIKGNFQLMQSNGDVNGTIEVSLSWKYSYLPPTAATRTLEQMVASPNEPPERLPVMSSDELTTTTPQTKPRVAARFPHRSPQATSTPLVKTGDSEVPKVTPRPRSGVSRRVKLDAATVNEAVTEAVTAVMPTLSSTMSTSEATLPPSHEISGVRELPESRDSLHPQSSSEPSVAEEMLEATSTSSHEMSMGELLSKVDSASLLEEIAVMPEEMSVSHPEIDEGERLTPTPEASSHSAGVTEDTMFGDTAEEIEEDIEETLPEIAEESDSEGVVMETAAHLRKNLTLVPGNSVTVVISYLTFEPDAAVLSQRDAEQFFVEYRFLDFADAELETPFALPKPKTPSEQLRFNFSKTFPVDLERHYEKRQLLASMLLPDDPTDGKIQMTVVTEPLADDENTECTDVGVASVSLKEILKRRRDVEDEDIAVYDIADKNTVIGHLNVSVHCVATLMAIEQEMLVTENSIG